MSKAEGPQWDGRFISGETSGVSAMRQLASPIQILSYRQVAGDLASMLAPVAL